MLGWVAVGTSLFLLGSVGKAIVSYRRKKEGIPRFDFICANALILFFLIPAQYHVLSRNFIPGLERFKKLHAFSGFFAGYSHGVGHNYLQVLTESGDKWTTVPSENYFQMSTFGALNKFYTFVETSREGSEIAKKRNEELSKWIVNQHQRLHPSQQRLRGVRFVFVLEKPSLVRVPKGPYGAPPLESFPESEWQIRFTYVAESSFYVPQSL